MCEQNLTNPQEIREAIQKKGGGRGAVVRLSRELGFKSRSILSMNINGGRRQEKVLQGVADFLGVGVHGVYPSNKKEKAA